MLGKMGLSDRINEGVEKVDCTTKWLVGSFTETQEICQRRVKGAIGTLSEGKYEMPEYDTCKGICQKGS